MENLKNTAHTPPLDEILIARFTSAGDAGFFTDWRERHSQAGTWEIREEDGWHSVYWIVSLAAVFFSFSDACEWIDDHTDNETAGRYWIRESGGQYRVCCG